MGNNQSHPSVPNTEAIDLWYLFPLGIGVNRLLKKDAGKMPVSWEAKLNSIFGTNELFKDLLTDVTVQFGKIGLGLGDEVNFPNCHAKRLLVSGDRSGYKSVCCAWFGGQLKPDGQFLGPISKVKIQARYI